ncbi:hypothetical protein OC846_006465 [Tilletia horrida]|uniref:Uncharacterized protein n=1 Tax=Tilletia horrida TaxID=155126 RepID=A0AAN6JNZ2_9BASI|nr:hypothetical protein OC846_006465 [Tilletia horrida]KAK0545702.1 hypothetical protein OC845_004985 [Tilletia horrida]KAK0562930.1 hypothetical protein OC861_005063 [Tilletia horrida]
MGRSAKGYKKPSLKEKQQGRKARSSTNAHALNVKDWEQPASSVRLAVSALNGPATGRASGSRRPAPAQIVQDEDEDDEGDEEEEVLDEAASGSAPGSGSSTHKKKRNLRARSRSHRIASSGNQDGADGASEARTPRDQGIDYLQLWQGRKKAIQEARVIQGRDKQS